MYKAHTLHSLTISEFSLFLCVKPAALQDISPSSRKMLIDENTTVLLASVWSIRTKFENLSEQILIKKFYF